MTRAVIFTTSDEYGPQLDRCMRYLNAKGYKFEGVVRGNWAQVQKIFDDDGATVAIVDRETYLDPNRKPRIEVAADDDLPQGDGQSGRPEHRRPRPLN